MSGHPHARPTLIYELLDAVSARFNDAGDMWPISSATLEREYTQIVGE